MRFVRLLKNYWYTLIGLVLIIIILVIPESKSYKKDVVYNTNHTYLSKIVVNVKGEVQIKGKMYFYEGDTILDLLNASGITDYTNSSSLKLDEALKDGYTYDISYNEGKEITIKNNSTQVQDIINTSKVNNVDSNKVNINTASIEMLKTLDGIGDAKAQAIISYRAKQAFTDIKDIKNVSGITDLIYDKIENYITV